MDEVEMVGAVLFGSADPVRASEALVMVLTTNADDEDIRAKGFNTSLVNALRSNLSKDRREAELACARGAGWVLGRRATQTVSVWELVASLPASVPLPAGVRRTTGETIVGLINGAMRRLRFAAPYVDSGGIAAITDAVIAATLRGVQVEIFDPPQWAPATEAIRKLKKRVTASGDSRLLLVRAALSEAPWSHLKVVVADGAWAYIGSANMTEAGLTRNLELGVLVAGDDVAAIDRILDIASR